MEYSIKVSNEKTHDIFISNLKGGCKHPNLYRSILMVLGLSDDDLRSHIWRIVLKTTWKVLENEFREAALMS